MTSPVQHREPIAERVDRQGNWSHAERVERAMQHFIADVDLASATYLESCIHCGLCSEACHYYIQSGEARFSPIWKLEPFKQAYKREMGPFSFFYKLFNLKHRVTEQELEQWQFLLYDACTLCGRCSLICPMGIDVASLIETARHGMYAAGLVPHELQAMAQRAEQAGSPLGVAGDALRESLRQLEQEYQLVIPLDREQAEVLVTLSAIEFSHYRESLVAMARVMNHLGLDWTIRSDGYEATNYGMLTGNLQWQRDMSRRVVDAALSCGARTVIVPECGSAYTALRWQAADVLGQELPFRVMHISEFLAEQVEQGRLKLNPASESATFHDPCQVARRGGVTDAPRAIFRALGVELKELPGGQEMNWCCGGGGGVLHIQRADELRYQNFKLKMRQVEDSGAEVVYTSCANCRANFEDCSEHYDWDVETRSLLGLVASHLAE